MRLRKNEALWSEHKSFFKKLQISRCLRSTVESAASLCIQRAYRGFSVRIRKDEIMESCLFRKRIRSQIRDYIVAHSDNRGTGIILTQGEHRKRYKEWHYQAASIIQRVFRCFHSRIFVKKVRLEMKGIKEIIAVIKLQCFFRNIAALRRASSLRSNRVQNMRARAALLMQSLFRRFKARRRVSRRRYKLRNTAAIIIQCCFRCHIVRALIKHTDQGSHIIHQNSSVVVIQCLVRRKYAYNLTKHLAEIRSLNRIHYYTSKIQAFIRGFLIRTFIKKMREVQRKAEKIVKKKSNTDFVNSMIAKSIKTKKSPLQDKCSKDDLDSARRGGKQNTFDQCSPRLSEDQISLNSAIENHDLNGIKDMAGLITSLTADDIVDILITAIQSFTSELEVQSLAVFTFLLSPTLGCVQFINHPQRGSGSTVLHMACTLGNRDAIRVLLQRNSLSNILDNQGYTAFHKACRANVQEEIALDIVYLLLGTLYS